MNDGSTPSPDQAPYRFAFSLSEEEIWTFRRYAGARVNRSLGGLGFYGALFLLIFVIALIVYAAYRLDYFDIDSLQPVLTATYLAFAAGSVAYSFAMHWQNRRLAKALYRLGAIDKEQWQYSFDDIGMLCRSQTVETRVIWRAMRAIDHNDTLLLLWADTVAGAYYVPARVFADAAERTVFVQWATERIAAARRQV